MTDVKKQSSGQNSQVADEIKAEEMAKTSLPVSDSEHAQCKEQLALLQAEVQQMREQALRAQADYQNLLRRTREEQSQMVKLATKSMAEDLLEPLEHLTMTAEQMNDKVLSMVVGQLLQALKSNGLEELAVMGKPFDVQTMEVVELQDGASEKDGVVVKIVKRGYALNGMILQHAKVVIGKKK